MRHEVIDSVLRPTIERMPTQAHRHPSAMWWRGVAAACVIGTTTLVVVHMQQAPEATVETRLRSDADGVVGSGG